MAELYGNAFIVAYGEQPTPLWLNAIAKLTDEQCKNGLSKLAKTPREYPANLTQFVAAATYKRPQSTLGPPTTTEALNRALPPPERQAPIDKIDAYLANLRRLLGPVAREDPVRRSSPACTCKASGECDTCKRFGVGAAQ